MFFIFAIFVFYVASAKALYISEIMYNPDGSDNKREWIEICVDKDLKSSEVFFKEAGVKHRLKDDVLWSANSCYLIAQDKNQVLSEFNIDSSKIVESSFSLSNKGELLQIIDKDGNILDSVNYSAFADSGKSGLSLQKINGAWAHSSPSPGKQNTANNTEPDANNGSDQKPSDGALQDMPKSQQNLNNDLSSFPKVKIRPPEDITIKIEMEKDKFATGELVNIYTETHDLEGKTKDVFVEVFLGDGHVVRKRSVKHVYKTEGDYIILARARNHNLFANSKKRIKVLPAKLKLERDGNFLYISNESSFDINIESWRLFCGSESVIFDANYLPALSKSAINLKDKFRYCDKDVVRLKSLTGQVWTSVERSREFKKEKGIKEGQVTESTTETDATDKDDPGNAENIKEGNPDQDNKGAQIDSTAKPKKENSLRKEGKIKHEKNEKTDRLFGKEVTEFLRASMQQSDNLSLPKRYDYNNLTAEQGRKFSEKNKTQNTELLAEAEASLDMSKFFLFLSFVFVSIMILFLYKDNSEFSDWDLQEE